MDINNTTEFSSPSEVQVQPQPQQYPKSNQKIPASIIVGVAVFIIFLSGGIYSSLKQKTSISNNKEKKQTISEAAKVTSTVKPSINPTENWKPIFIDNISFKYPADFQDPQYIKTSFGLSAEIKNGNNTQRIIVLSGINKGYTEKELSEFLDMFVEGGGQKLFLDNNMTVIIKDVSLGKKIVTAYVNAKDNKSQYSISIESLDSYSDKEINTLLFQIFETLKFE